MPFIDIYRFKLDSYNIRLKNIKFGELAKAEKGVIFNNYSEDDPTNNPDNIYTFDYLSGNKNFRNKYYNFYLNQPAKPDSEDYLLGLKYLTTEKMYLKSLVNRVLTKQKKIPFISKNFGYLQTENKSGYIKKIILDSREKIIIFGDNHGSFHTFYRNLLRLHLLGIIDLEKYTINPNYRLLFLGDIVDRGAYGLEILSILFEFMIRDTDYRLIINRGNHEEIEINDNYGFKEEVNYKHSLPLWQMINNIFVTLPSAHILINPETNTKIWCCHGFLPIDIYSFKGVLYEFIESDNVNLLLDEYISYQIRWNDPYVEGRSVSRGDNIFVIPFEITKSYLDIFDYIIRGHNDNYSNAFILKNNNIMDFTKLSNIIGEIKNPMFKFYLNDIIDNITKLEIQVNEPISTINLKQRNEDFLNVLTISTNTDLGRNLEADSFILLRFDEDVNNILPNSSMIKTMPIEIDFINNKEKLEEFLTIREKDQYLKKKDDESDNENFKIKYLKYKNKYLKLKNKI
jgi:hypothetical protein